MNKKASIIETASRLFSKQGYEATTTLQIAREVGITEPAVFYHFKNKNALFTEIIEAASNSFIKRIDALDLSGEPAFGYIEALIRIHFSVVAEEPESLRILLRTCPARMEEPENACAKVYRQVRRKMKDTVGRILERGVISGEFRPISIDVMSNVLIALLNGLMRQQIEVIDDLEGVEAAAIVFCKNALLFDPT